jgi:hypothetical protein
VRSVDGLVDDGASTASSTFCCLSHFLWSVDGLVDVLLWSVDGLVDVLLSVSSKTRK